MANYLFRSQFNYSYSAKTVTLRASVSFGASGAPTLVSGTGMGISSIARNSTGDYTLTLSRSYNGLMMMKHIFKTTAAPAAPGMWIKSNLVSSTPSTLEIVFNAAGTATDPASGEVVSLEIILNDSSLPY